MGQERFGTTQVTAFTTNTAVPNAFGAQTYRVRLAATAACFIRIGDGVQTATVADVLLPAGVVDYVTVTPGQRISAVQQTAGGSLCVTEMI